MHVASETQGKREQNVARRLNRIIPTLARYTPFKSNCMVQAMAAKRMFQKRGIASTLYIGVGKDEKENKLNHAWLKIGSLIVTGNMKDLTSYAVLATYAETTL